MSQSSATECDSGSEASGCHGRDVAFRPVELGDTTLPGNLFRSIETVPKNAIHAVNRLYDIRDNLRNLLQDENAAEELEACFIDVLLFVEAESGGLLSSGGRENQDFTRCIIAIFDAEFLCILLDVRVQLLQIAPDYDQSGGMLVCWVDKFFASCWECISRIAGCHWKLMGPKESHLPSLSSYKEEENLRTACQIPKTWRQFPELLQSGHASQAAKRLALCILFAAFVIRPDLEDCDPWAENDVNPGCIVECLQSLVEEFAKQARDLAISDNRFTLRHLRIAFAMAIVLYSSAETAHRLRSDQHSPSFQPHTLACMLELMHAIFPSKSQLPTTAVASDDLDDAQVILLHWGVSIPWIWEKWNDSRIMGFSVVITVTANWLTHLDKSLPLVSWNEDSPGVDGTEITAFPAPRHALRSIILVNPTCSLIALAHQIHDETSREVDSASFLRLHRATWCIAELIENRGDQLAPGDLSLVVEQLVMFFAELGEVKEETHSKVKVEIIRCLYAVKPTTIEKVLFKFNKNISFFTKVANAIAKASRMITGEAGGGFLLAAGVPDGLVALLDFLSLFFKHNASKCLPATSFVFLADLVKFLSRRLGTPALRISLLNCLSNAHGQYLAHGSEGQAEVIEVNVGTKSRRKTWNDESVYNLALDIVCADLDLAAAFASYVLLTIKKNMDPLLVFETWDCLQNMLILLTSGCLEDCDTLIKDKDPISSRARTSTESAKPNRIVRVLSAAEQICAALAALLDRSDNIAVLLVLDSPTTTSLSVSLERFMRSAQTGCFNGTVEDGNAEGSRSSSSAENDRQSHEQLVRAFGSLLEKLRKKETGLNKVL